MKLYNLDDTTNPFKELFSETIKVKDITEIKRDGVLILWGGADIWPGLYGERPNRFVYTYQESMRDSRERQAINHCIKYDIPIIGICRGGQLACVVAGGKLLQHIEDHGRSHKVTLLDEDHKSIACNSSHHQMMIPPKDAKVLAIDGKTYGVNGDNNAVVVDSVPEVVWLPSIKALCIQPHPEWSSSPKEFNAYCERKIKEYILCQP